MNPLVLVGAEWLGSLTLFLGFILLIRYLDHRERMAMIARGLVPARGSRARTRRGGSAALRGGMITAMVGLAVTFALYTMGYLLPPPFSAVPGRFGPWLLPGLIPLCVGLALIASHYMAASQDMMVAGPNNDQATPPAEKTPEGSGPTDDGGRAVGRVGGASASWRLLGGSAAHALDEEREERDASDRA